MPVGEGRKLKPISSHSALLDARIIHYFEDYGYNFMQKRARGRRTEQRRSVGRHALGIIQIIVCEV